MGFEYELWGSNLVDTYDIRGYGLPMVQRYYEESTVIERIWLVTYQGTIASVNKPFSNLPSVAANNGIQWGLPELHWTDINDDAGSVCHQTSKLGNVVI